MHDNTLSRSFASTSISKLPTSLWTEVQAAAFLGVQTKSLQAWRIRGGGPPFMKIGRLIRYRPARLEEWLEARERVSTSDPGK